LWWCCFTKSLAHAAVAMVVVVADTTIIKPLLHHHQLRPLQTLGFWRGPCPLLPIGCHTGQWSPRTMMSHREIAMAALLSSMVGAGGLTRLH
jgi:hypothetical protein